MTCIRPGCQHPRPPGGLWCTGHRDAGKARQRANAEVAGTTMAVAGGPGGIRHIVDNNWREWPAYAWSRKRDKAYLRAIGDI